LGFTANPKTPQKYAYADIGFMNYTFNFAVYNYLPVYYAFGVLMDKN